MNYKDRLEYIDIVKGIGILFVVIGHCITKDMANNNYLLYICRLAIYTVHMPLFFIVSGILFKHNSSKYKMVSVKHNIKNKMKTFIIPYISFSILNYIIFEIMLIIPQLNLAAKSSGYSHHSLFQFIISTITYTNVVDDHLWFIYVMFFIYIIAFNMNKLYIEKYKIKNDKLRIFMYLFVLYELTYWLKFPELIFKIIRYGFLFYIGCNFNKFIAEKKYNDFIITIIFLVSFTIYAYIKLYDNDIYIICLIIPIIEILGSYLIIKLSYVYLRVSKFKTTLSFLGKNSYPIYLLHQPFIVNGLLFLLLSFKFSYFYTIIISTIFGCIIPLMLNEKIIQKSRILKLYLLGGYTSKVKKDTCIYTVE